MINEIKRIIENYLNNIKLTSIVIGTVVDGGVKLTDKLTIPLNFITGNLKKYIIPGDKLRLLRNLGGQEFLLLEIIDKNIILEIGTVVGGGVEVNNKVIPSNLVTGNLKKFIKDGDKVRVIRNLGIEEIYIVEIIDRNVILENTKIEINRVTFKDGDFIEDISIKEVM